MTRMIKWPSIEQFRTVVKNIQHRAQYVGTDEEGNVIVDRTRKNPTLKFRGTVKLHGTNASVVMNNEAKMWVQSRENIITPEKDNAGFAMFVEGYKKGFEKMLIEATNIYDESGGKYSNQKDIAIYGEWCGGNIQKTVALNELPKMFVVFGIAMIDAEGNKEHYTEEMVAQTFAMSGLMWENKVATRIFSIYDFPSYEMDIDFENPHESQNILNELTEKVGDECPVAKAFGVSGVGEGIVWRCVNEGFTDSGYWFKVKDERHSNSKVKVLATVDVERINNIKELAERLAHNGRLEQMAQSTFDLLNGGEIDVKRIGDMIKAVMSDVAKEDMDIIAASGFNMKEVSGPIAKLVRDFVLKGL